MAERSDTYQAPFPVWRALHEPSEEEATDVNQLRQRVQELEARVEEYEALLEELPALFERKFQQRLEPLLERYRLLASSQDLNTTKTPPLLKAALRWRQRNTCEVNNLKGNNGEVPERAA